MTTLTMHVRQTWSVFRKSLREQARDILGLSLVLIFAPLFVFLYRLFFPSGSTAYGVLVINDDAGSPAQTVSAGDELIEAMQSLTYADGQPLLKVERVTDRAAAEAQLRDRAAAALVIIPPAFSQAVQTPGTQTATVTLVGDLTNPYYSLAAIMASAALDQYVQGASGQVRPVLVAEQALGASAARTEFENYVPGLLVFAVMMLIFLAAMNVAREVEAGTLRRLRLTRMTAFDFLGGISGALILVGVAAVALTFLAALALGFRSQGPLWVAVLVGAVTSLSMIGVGLLVACMVRTVTQAFLAANFPLALFMFFSGSIYPVPRSAL
ncbi:MAG: ABC transporter permease, partial [Chloroflexi bacterium]|nr:ABC transporter permease [Chloroflexota bacterium]